MFVINEKYIDFNDFEPFESKLKKDVKKQNFNGYFNILHGSIYTKLIKESWLNASVIPVGHQEIIQSYVNGTHLYITLPLIAMKTNCEELSSYVEHYKFNNVYVTHLHLLFANQNNFSSPTSLIPNTKFCFQLLVSNIHPREKELETLTWYDTNHVLFLTYNIRFNLTIFNFLKEII